MTRGDRVLVVEDDPLNRDVLVRLCRSNGFEVEATEDGPSALARLESWPPDVVLLDVSMPGMSGLEVLRSIREQRSADSLPVLLVSARHDSEDIVVGLEAGANDYVTKPYKPKVLLARLRAAMRLKQGVDRLLAAERHRVMLDSLADTCDRLAKPMAAVLSTLQLLKDKIPEQDDELRSKLSEIDDWAGRVADLLDRFQVVASYRLVPYTEGMEGFIAASLEVADGESEVRSPGE